jgi:tripeptide aminopeptidase
VRPQIVKPYVGGDIALGGAGQFIRASDCPALEQLIGHTLVTTDGRTLLGGDDKAGVAVIMELAQYLSEHPETPHGAVQILFTCDEEIGRGTDKIDMREISALAGYTLDGSGAGNLEAENFSADQLIITALGHNIHPSIAKGTMVNASHQPASRALAVAALIARVDGESSRLSAPLRHQRRRRSSRTTHPAARL